MEPLIVGILLALLSGITWIAYKHPAGYRKIFVSIELIVILGASTMLTWNIALDFAYANLSQFVESGKHDEALAARDNLQVPQLLMWLVLGICAYLLFLLKLPEILDDNRKKTTKHPGDA